MRQTIVVLTTILMLGLPWGSSVALTQDEANTIAAHESVSPSIVQILVQGMAFDEAQQEIEEVRGGGSGFAVKPGLIITNYHVIENATRIHVTLSNWGIAKAAVVGTAPGYDLALLRVDISESELPPAPLGSSRDLKIGQKVIAIGSPLGLQHSVTEGIVSGLNRELPGLDLGQTLIQFDAAANPGQSGGPLVDSDGRVIGVTTAKILDAEAVGFAIPIDLVKEIVPDLEHMGHTFRPQLGFTGTGIDPDVAALFGLPAEWGVLVEEIVEGSVAAQAGLAGGSRHVVLGGQRFVLGGDIIVALNGEAVTGLATFKVRLLRTEPGEGLTFSVLRNDDLLHLHLQVPEMRHE